MLTKDHSVNTAENLIAKPSFTDWLFFVPFVLAFFLVLLLFDLAQKIVFFLHRESHQGVITWLNKSLVATLRILNIRLVVENRGDYDLNKQYIIIANHQSLLDIPITYCLFPKQTPRYVAKKELGCFIPSVSFNLRNGGNALIDRKNPRQAIREISKFAERMKALGFSAVFFPEGTRARDGILKEFRVSGIQKLLELMPETEVIPVTLEGSWLIQARRFGPIPRNITIHAVINKTIKRSESNNAKDIVAKAQSVIEADLKKLRDA
jgi:1-acyl-sn-glycerol-3-phosphate acyltransferase